MNYSIVIRTVGTAGEKYQRLLNSIQNLKTRPIEVLVVLPEGATPPPERLGYETFLYCEKGMVSQRVYGGKYAKGAYVLFTDDDIEFSSDFVDLLYEPIYKGKCNVTAVADETLLPPKRGIRKWVPLLTLSACPTVLHKDMYVKILRSGGWSYNRKSFHNQSYMYTESAPGMCFFCSREDFLQIYFEDDLWLQDEAYALWDDQVMFYKFHLHDKRVMCLTDKIFEHLDAGSNSNDRAVKAAHANSRNKYIFWYKYIFLQQQNFTNRLLSIIFFQYSKWMSLFLRKIGSLRSKNKRNEYVAYKQGYIDGYAYIKSTNFEGIK